MPVWPAAVEPVPTGIVAVATLVPSAVLTFGATFLHLGLLYYSGVEQWFMHYGLLPATAVREVILLLIVELCLAPPRRWLALAPDSSSPYEADQLAKPQNTR
jgi:hypothetical protein